MKLAIEPTKIQILKTFQDKYGSQYELRGQKNMHSAEGCFKTNYYELYKKDSRGTEFKKVGAKEEVNRASYYGYLPSSIQREKIIAQTGEVTERSEVFKKLNGYDIECRGKSLTLDGALRVIHAKDQYGEPFTKIKIPNGLYVNGNQPLTAMAKRVMKLLQYVK